MQILRKIEQIESDFMRRVADYAYIPKDDDLRSVKLAHGPPDHHSSQTPTQTSKVVGGASL